MLEADVGGGHVVGHDQVGPLAGQLGRRVAAQVRGLRGEADEDLAVGLAGAQGGQDVLGLLQHDRVEAAGLLLDLAAATRAGRKSATAAAMTITSALGEAVIIASCICAAVSTRT